MDLPQSVLEPILLKYATQNGFKVRFNAKFVTFKPNEKTGLTTTIIEDSLTGQFIRVESKYLFGADGANSEVVKQLQLPLKTGGKPGEALNVWFDADLTPLLETRRGLLHCILQPDREDNEMLLFAVLRMVRPWHEWILYCFPPPGAEANWRPSDEIILDRVKRFIGDSSIFIKVKRISKWTINETVAEKYSEGNM
jgi:2-polyprenyl-6-methoxyphenol hydroxylase-like FAD-dependent oxidoreductase